jgi:hypothetical protein
VRFNPGCACCNALVTCNPCTGGVPTTIHATLSGSGLACLDGKTIPLVWDGSITWVGSYTLVNCCGLSDNCIAVSMVCNGNGTVNINATVSCTGCPAPTVADGSWQNSGRPLTCTPLGASGTSAYVITGGGPSHNCGLNCLGGVTLTITITT